MSEMGLVLFSYFEHQSHHIYTITSATNKSITGIVLFISNLSAFSLHFDESCPCHNNRVGIGHNRDKIVRD